MKAPFFPRNCFSLPLLDTPLGTDIHPLLPLSYPLGLEVTVVELLNSVKTLLLRATLVPTSMPTHFLKAELGGLSSYPH